MRAIKHIPDQNFIVKRVPQSSGLSQAWHNKVVAYERTGKKQEQRDRVLDFMRGAFVNADSGSRPTLLCLPGRKWIFERMFSNMAFDEFCSPSRFIALERNYAEFERSALHMIDTRTMRRKWRNRRTFDIGSASFESVKSASGWLFNVSAEEYLSMMFSYGLSEDEKKTWKFSFGLNNFAWLDFTGYINDSILAALSLLPFSMTTEGVKPVALTFKYGREPGMKGGVSGRAKAIEGSMGCFKSSDAWIYDGVGGGKMITICGFVE